MLIGRAAERGVIDSLVAHARSAQSGVLLLRGEAGIGKTALLEYASTAAAGMSIHRLVGTELEKDLGFGGLSQLAPTHEELSRLPAPQASALAVALNLEAGPSVVDRFAIGAATLGLLTRRAEDQPLALLIDDAHLLDHLSAAALAFAARRLVADPILLVAALRSDEPSVLLTAGLPVLELAGLDVAAATELLAGEPVKEPRPPTSRISSSRPEATRRLCSSWGRTPSDWRRGPVRDLEQSLEVCGALRIRQRDGMFSREGIAAGAGVVVHELPRRLRVEPLPRIRLSGVGRLGQLGRSDRAALGHDPVGRAGRRARPGRR